MRRFENRLRQIRVRDLAIESLREVGAEGWKLLVIIRLDRFADQESTRLENDFVVARRL